MSNSQMVRMQNWEQISLKNACMLNLTLKVTNTGLWIILLTISNTVSKGNQNVTVNGKSYKQKTTRGWKLCIEWKDKSTSWERLSDMKESCPVEVAEYAEAVGISDAPAFSWWTAHVLKKRQRIFVTVNKRYHKLTHKFRIKVPKTGEEALACQNGNDLSWKAIQKEMSAVKVPFKILDEDERTPIGSQYMKYHMVFSIKIDRILTYGTLLDVLWQMYHAWITYGTVRRIA